MSARLPTLFVSHGAPTMAPREDDTTRFLCAFSDALPRLAPACSALDAARVGTGEHSHRRMTCEGPGRLAPLWR